MILYAVSIALLVIITVLQILISKESFALIMRRVFWISVAIIGGILVYYSVNQYVSWQDNPLTENFFNDGPGYYIRYVLYTFWSQYIVSFVIAVLFMFAARAYNKKNDGKFFYDGEDYAIGAGLFLNGHPNWIVYLLVVIFGYAVISAIQTWRIKRSGVAGDGSPRISFYHGWLPAGIIALALKPYVAKTAIGAVLIFSKTYLII